MADDQLQVSELIKTLVFGVILGVLGSGALAWYVPAVDLHRERSHISVLPNGGNAEVFHINLPRDRILVGLPDGSASLPADLAWPGEEHLPGLQAELFKIRDRNNTVIGVASRLASASEPAGEFIEWVLHLPARGSIYVDMGVTPAADGYREGTMRTGTRDFRKLGGTVRVKLVDAEEGDIDIENRIEIQTILVAPPEDEA